MSWVAAGRRRPAEGSEGLFAKGRWAAECLLTVREELK